MFSEKAAKKLKGSLFLRLLEDRAVEGETDPDPRCYPKAARKGLEAGMIVASSDADVFFLWPQKDKTAKVCHAHPESFSVLGETVVDFVQKQVKLVTG